MFDDHLALDLGGREVELWHFGPGNSPGDTVVWVPEARAAWTGNLVSNQRARLNVLATYRFLERADEPVASGVG